MYSVIASAGSSRSETTRQQPIVDHLFVYEPGVPIRGQLRTDWLDDYQRRLERGDRRGAFASMAKGAGFAPKVIEAMPVWFIRLGLRIALRGHQWATTDNLLEVNLVEHRLLAGVDAPGPERFSTITCPNSSDRWRQEPGQHQRPAAPRDRRCHTLLPR